MVRKYTKGSSLRKGDIVTILNNPVDNETGLGLKLASPVSSLDPMPSRSCLQREMDQVSPSPTGAGSP